MLVSSQADSLSASQLSTLSTDDFDDCAETLGTLSTWDDEQLAALVDRAKAVRL